MGTPPKFPTPLPPYSTASLLKRSTQKPPVGTPARTLSRGTGVKLQTTSALVPPAEWRT